MGPIGISDPGQPKVQSLTRRAVSAATSMAAMSGLENLLVFVRTLILSRLLSPHDFGLMGMAFIAIATTNVLSQTGFGRAIVQRQDDPKPYLDTLWSVSAIRGVLLALFLIAAAPLLGMFFRTPDVVPLLRLISLGPAIMGLASAAWVILERDLKLARYSLPRVAGAAADLCITTVLAWQLRSAYALAGGYLVFCTVFLIVTFVVAPFAPRFRLDRQRIRTLYGFGKHVFRFEVLSYSVEQVDRLVIGRLKDPTQLGYYSFAWRMATIPTTLIFTIMLSVVFPSFARIQGEPGRVRAAYLRLLTLMSTLTLPVAAGLYSVSDVLVSVVFGQAWIPMVPSFRALALMAGLVTMGQMGAAVAGSLGLPVVAARASLTRLLVVSVLVIPVAMRFGIAGVAWSAAGAALVYVLVLLVAMARHLELPRFWYLIPVGVPLLSCLVMVLFVRLAHAVTGLEAPLDLVLRVLVGAAAYVLSMLVMDRLTQAGFVSTFRGMARAR